MCIVILSFQLTCKKYPWDNKLNCVLMLSAYIQYIIPAQLLRKHLDFIVSVSNGAAIYCPLNTIYVYNVHSLWVVCFFLYSEKETLVNLQPLLQHSLYCGPERDFEMTSAVIKQCVGCVFLRTRCVLSWLLIAADVNLIKTCHVNFLQWSLLIKDTPMCQEKINNWVVSKKLYMWEFVKWVHRKYRTGFMCYSAFSILQHLS